MKHQLVVKQLSDGTFQWFALPPPGETCWFPGGRLEFLNFVTCLAGEPTAPAEGSEDMENKPAQAVRRES